jgi:hypothetical protein
MAIGSLKNPRWILWVSQSLQGMSPTHIAAQWTKNHTSKDSIGDLRVKITIGSGLKRIRKIDSTGRLETILRDAYQPKLTSRLVMLVITSKTLAQQEGVNPLDYALSSMEESRRGERPTKFLQYLRKLPV